MFLVLRPAARAEDCVMRFSVECFKQQIKAQIRAQTRAQIRAQIRAEKRLLQRNDLRSACPR